MGVLFTDKKSDSVRSLLRSVVNSIEKRMRGFESKRDYSEILRLRVDSEFWAVAWLRRPQDNDGRLEREEGAYDKVPCLVKSYDSNYGKELGYYVFWSL